MAGRSAARWVGRKGAPKVAPLVSHWAGPWDRRRAESLALRLAAQMGVRSAAQMGKYSAVMRAGPMERQMVVTKVFLLAVPTEPNLAETSAASRVGPLAFPWAGWKADLWAAWTGARTAC